MRHRRCGAVSKTWNYLSRDNSLWKELYYTNFDLPQQELNKCSGSEGYTFVATIGASKDKDSLETEESIEQKDESKDTSMKKLTICLKFNSMRRCNFISTSLFCSLSLNIPQR
jgi:hypothetical protein